MRKANKPISSAARFTGIAMQMMITILTFTAIGYYIDTYFDLKFPFGVLFGSISGIAIALYRVFKSLQN
jgi:F0F1-type ATP synthase assembly protein I